MATKVKEITSNPHGDPKTCSMCNDRDDRVGHDKVWAFTLRTGLPGLKDNVRV